MSRPELGGNPVGRSTVASPAESSSNTRADRPASWPRYLRPLVGLLVLGVVAAILGPQTLVHGVRAVSPEVLFAGAVLALLTTLAASGRWVLIARAARLRLTLRTAVPAYYRSLLLNATLPGGVLGDVDRALWHSVDQRDVARASGAVVVERAVSQTVQLVLTALALVVWRNQTDLPRTLLATLLVSIIGFGALTLVVARRTLRSDSAEPTRPALSPTTLVAIVGLCVVAITGYVATFVIAANAVGASAPLQQLVPLGLVVVSGSAIPLNIAGWGPREGVAAWVFASAGLGADVGVAAAAAYGVIALVSVLPGVVPLILGRSGPASGRSV